MATTKALDEDGVVLLASDIKTLSDATYPSNAAIASAYDATAAYSVGDYCLRNGLLYKCNTAISSGGEVWTAAHWTQVSVVDEMGSGDATGAVRADIAQSFTSSEKQQARENVSAEAKSLRFFNTVVPVSAFEANDGTTIVSNYDDYTCRATIPLTNVTSQMIPDVIFATEDATSGIFSPNSETYNGGIYIYSSEIPLEAVTIPTIVCWTQDSNATDNWGTVPQNIYTITLPASGWVLTDSTAQYWRIDNPYYQIAAIPNAVITSYTKVDLQPNTQVLTHLDSVRATGIYTENHNGAITVYVNGGKPTENLSIQCTVLEMDTQNPVGNYVGIPTSSDEYYNFNNIDGTSYINDTNWETWHTGFHMKNGWGMIVINGAAKIAMSADTYYEIVDIPSFIVEKIGATAQYGFAFAGSVPCMAELNTWDGGHTIRLQPRAAVGKSTNITGTIIFVVS